jgi:hypothetical protein
MNTLDQRITSALTSDITSTDLATIIGEVEAAIVEAAKTAATVREQALDPILMPDPNKARAATEAASFNVARLKATLPRLKQRHREIETAEHVASWEADCDRVEVMRDAAAKKFAKYPELVAQIVDLLRDAEQVDKEVWRVNISAPSGPYRHLVAVECAARGIPAFSSSEPQISKGVQLPDYERSTQMAWPVRRPPDFSVIPAMVPHPGADWASEHRKRAEAIQCEHERTIAYYENMAKERAEREERAMSGAHVDVIGAMVCKPAGTP